MADEIPARFRKTKNDTWAVMAPVAALEKAIAEGGKIDVQRKSGDWSTFTVGSLGRPFDVDGVQMCYGYPPAEVDSDDVDGSPPASNRRPASPDRGQGAVGNDSRRAKPAAQRPRSRPTTGTSQPPGPDPTEPLPEFQGGAEDEWDGGF